MIKEIHQTCEKLNEKLGVSVSLPNPDQKTLKTTAACNFIAGAGMMTVGVLFPSKWCAILGGVGMIGSIILRKEYKNKNDDL